MQMEYEKEEEFWELVEVEFAKKDITQFESMRLLRASAIADVLNISTLSRVDLSDIRLKADGAEKIAEVLKSNNTLTDLDLSFNDIRAKGTKAIAKSLKVNKTLTHINLNRNFITIAGAKYLMKALKSNTTLRYIDFLKGNELDMSFILLWKKHYLGIQGLFFNRGFAEKILNACKENRKQENKPLTPLAPTAAKEKEKDIQVQQTQKEIEQEQLVPSKATLSNLQRQFALLLKYQDEGAPGQLDRTSYKQLTVNELGSLEKKLDALEDILEKKLAMSNDQDKRRGVLLKHPISITTNEVKCKNRNFI